ncbi:hypothetical protein D1007_07870 [Hordeum vulgare]|nr:hypothetical protein D1007_07870 [Hordeum vulgare]
MYRRDAAAYDEPCTPRRGLLEGSGIGVPSTADPRIRVSPGATRRAMIAVTTPSRRERASPPPVYLKIAHVFTLANTHRHGAPHPGYHAAHMTMATVQHHATGSVHDHHATTTRAAAPTSKTLTPPHPRPAVTPTKNMGEKIPPFAPLGIPQCRDRIGWPKLASIAPSCSPRANRVWSYCRA